MPQDETRPSSVATAAVIATLLFTPAWAGAQQPNPSDECPAPGPTYRVGHTIERLDVTGTLGETRHVEVHVWYPARDRDDCSEAADFPQGAGGCHAAPAVYTSRLNGVGLVSPWVPLSWTIAGNAFEGPRIATGDERFPVIVFSHGNTVNAFEYAYTLEALASHGYVVAAPDHVNNTQDDVRIDVVDHAGEAKIACFDGLPSPCSHASIPDSLVDRYRDAEAVLDALPTWFGPRVDMKRVGIMGHSRGTVTALSVAGGSTAWGFRADSRVKAVMGMAIGAESITFGADVKDVTVPLLLVGGTLDVTSPLWVSEEAVQAAASTDKLLVPIQNAVHRHFESANCAVVQSAGAIAQGDTLAALDHETARQILQPPSAAHPGSGIAMDFCGFDTFTTPTDIRPFVQEVTLTTFPPAGFLVTSSNVPRHGLTSDTVKDEVIRLATAFFGRVLNRPEGDDRPFSDCIPDELKNQPPVPAPTQADRDEAELHANDPE